MSQPILSDYQAMLLASTSYLDPVGSKTYAEQIDYYSEGKGRKIVTQAEPPASQNAKGYDAVFTAVKADPKLPDLKIVSSLGNYSATDPKLKALEKTGLSAVAYQDPTTKKLIVVFRGTESSKTSEGNDWLDNVLGMLGAKETPQQKAAIEYVKYLQSQGYDIDTVLGHSKGGNLATTVLIKVNGIAHCITLDSQGYSLDWLKENAQAIKERGKDIVAYKYTGDVVGSLLNQIPGSIIKYINPPDKGNKPWYSALSGSVMSLLFMTHVPMGVLEADKTGKLTGNFYPATSGQSGANKIRTGLANLLNGVAFSIQLLPKSLQGPIKLLLANAVGEFFPDDGSKLKAALFAISAILYLSQMPLLLASGYALDAASALFASIKKGISKIIAWVDANKALLVQKAKNMGKLIEKSPLASQWMQLSAISVMAKNTYAWMQKSWKKIKFSASVSSSQMLIANTDSAVRAMQSVQRASQYIEQAQQYIANLNSNINTVNITGKKAMQAGDLTYYKKSAIAPLTRVDLSGSVTYFSLVSSRLTQAETTSRSIIMRLA